MSDSPTKTPNHLLAQTYVEQLFQKCHVSGQVPDNAGAFVIAVNIAQLRLSIERGVAQIVTRLDEANEYSDSLCTKADDAMSSLMRLSWVVGDGDEHQQGLVRVQQVEVSDEE